jgi:hypothetical protein
VRGPLRLACRQLEQDVSGGQSTSEGEEESYAEPSTSTSAATSRAKAKGKEVDPLERGFERLLIAGSEPNEVRIYFLLSYFLLNLTL